MSRITLTIHIDMPDGITPDVEYADKPRVLRPPATSSPPPQAVAEPQEPPHVAEAQRVFADDVASWPAGQCPKHLRPWKQGKYGPYCSAKDDSTEKGFCALKPGIQWNGKRIPEMAA